VSKVEDRYTICEQCLKRHGERPNKNGNNIQRALFLCDKYRAEWLGEDWKNPYFWGDLWKYCSLCSECDYEMEHRVCGYVEIKYGRASRRERKKAIHGLQGMFEVGSLGEHGRDSD
jgi:hypothetical protein